MIGEGRNFDKKVFEKKEVKKGQQSGRNLTELHKVIYDKKNLDINGITDLSKYVDNQLLINNVDRSFIDLLNFKNFKYSSWFPPKSSSSF